VEFAVETEGLVGGYGRNLVLRQVFLRVPRGSIYGFLGPNGAGKTTAMRILLGLIRPFSGQVRLFGESIPRALPGILARVGSLIEQPSLYDHLTGLENLRIITKLKKLRRSDIEQAIEAAGIRSYVGEKTGLYSRGMRQRLGIAIAILGRPDLLLLDEPMNGLDLNGLQAFRTLLKSLNKDCGTTILLSSHQFEEVEQVATHIGILSEMGDLLFQGTRQELFARVPLRLIIKAEPRVEALRVLEAANFTVDSTQEYLTVQTATQKMAREVTRLLVTAGIEVDHLEMERSTLQVLFTKITKTVQPWSVE